MAQSISEEDAITVIRRDDTSGSEEDRKLVLAKAFFFLTNDRSIDPFLFPATQKKKGKDRDPEVILDSVLQVFASRRSMVWLVSDFRTSAKKELADS